MTDDGYPIAGTQYRHGQEVQHDTEFSCPQRCEIPAGRCVGAFA